MIAGRKARNAKWALYALCQKCGDKLLLAQNFKPSKHNAVNLGARLHRWILRHDHNDPIGTRFGIVFDNLKD